MDKFCELNNISMDAEMIALDRKEIKELDRKILKLEEDDSDKSRREIMVLRKQRDSIERNSRERFIRDRDRMNSVPFINTKSNRRSIGKSMFGGELQNAKSITIQKIVDMVSEWSAGDIPSAEEIKSFLEDEGYEANRYDIQTAIKEMKEYMNG